MIEITLSLNQEDPGTTAVIQSTPYLVLDENDFKCLVRGGVLRVGNDLNIALRDIGFMKMINAIDSAERGEDTYKDHKKEG